MVYAQEVQATQTAKPQQTFDKAAFKQALIAYQSGQTAVGDVLAVRQSDTVAKAALEWAAIRSSKSVFKYSRLNDFFIKYPDFPVSNWIKRRTEIAFFNQHRSYSETHIFLLDKKPETIAGKFAFAKIKQAEGDLKTAETLARDAWRESTFSSSLSKAIEIQFPNLISENDNRYRAENYVFRNRLQEALHVGSNIGPGYTALLRALHASLKERSHAKLLLDAVPVEEQGSAPYIFAKAQFLRRAGKLAEAARTLVKASYSQEKLVSAHEWWVERRFLTRKLLDTQDFLNAYAVASGYSATQDADRVDAEFTAGWIALRYLHDAEAAEAHFQKASSFARTPLSISRSNYWLGRARQDTKANALPASAISALERAAIYGTTYYGQLASAALGHTYLNIRAFHANNAEKDVFSQRIGAQAIRLLMENDAHDLAQVLAQDYAETLTKSVELDALNQILAEYKKAELSLRIAKAANYRGFPMDNYAFPQFGIPDFIPLADSAEKAMVYAIARQESAFNPKAVSGVGARGLMQMMPATAVATARNKGLRLALNQLVSDPQLNAKLGAAHLGALLQSTRGSYIMVFAAYNAGPGRVQEWIRAYGDPRNPQVDAVDWVERIPITETRNYVQRVMENMQVYRALFSQDYALVIKSDMLRGVKPLDNLMNDDEILTGSLKK